MLMLNKVQRRGVQIERMLILIDVLRDQPSVTLADLKRKVKPKVCERTIRRDLAILTRLNWTRPIDGTAGETRWQWVKD